MAAGTRLAPSESRFGIRAGAAEPGRCGLPGPRGRAGHREPRDRYRAAVSLRLHHRASVGHAGQRHRRCDATREAEVFHAARLHLGCLGAVTALTLELRSASRLREESRSNRWRKASPRFPTWCSGVATWSARGFPTPTSSVCARERPEEPVNDQPLHRGFAEQVVDNGLFGLVAGVSRLPGLARARPALRRMVAGMAGARPMWIGATRCWPPRAAAGQRDGIRRAGGPGPDAIRAIARYVRRERRRVLFPIEYRYVAADDIPLSPFYGRDGAVLSPSIRMLGLIGTDTSGISNGSCAIWVGGRAGASCTHSMRSTGAPLWGMRSLFRGAQAIGSWREADDAVPASRSGEQLARAGSLQAPERCAKAEADDRQEQEQAREQSQPDHTAGDLLRGSHREVSRVVGERAERRDEEPRCVDGFGREDTRPSPARAAGVSPGRRPGSH